MDKDLGGYVLIAENIVDIEVLKDVADEHTDVIEGSGGVNYTSSLFLISSDYVVYDKETLIYINLDIANYVIKLIPVRDSYSYIYTYLKKRLK